MTQWDKDVHVPYIEGRYPTNIHYPLCSRAACESEARDVENMDRINPLGKPVKVFTNSPS